MKTITRYGLGREYAGNTGSPAITEQPGGDYVRHADHVVITNGLQAELDNVERMAAAQTVTIAELQAQQPDHFPGATKMMKDAEKVDAAELRSRIHGAITDVSHLAPEDDETWDEWYATAFDLLGERVGKILDLYTIPIAAKPDPAMAGDDRAAFEAWHSTYGIEDGKAQAWDAWQASSKHVQPTSGEDAK